MTVNGPCMCGATDCQSCGPAQGFQSEAWQSAYEVIGDAVLRTPDELLDVIVDRDADGSKPVDVDALCDPFFDATTASDNELLAVMLNGANVSAHAALAELRDRVRARLEDRICGLAYDMLADEAVE